jgi:cyanophycin synthetase
MVQATFVQFRTFDGPSLHAPFAAAIAEVDVPAAPALAAERLRLLLDEYLPERLARGVVVADEPMTFVEIAAALAGALHDLQGACDLPLRVDRSARVRARIVMGYHDVQTALHALRGGLELANALLGRLGGGPDPRPTVEAVVRRVDAVMALRQPDPIARALIRAARARGMPVYPLAPGSRVWQYGQGARGIHFFEAANHQDSPTGARLAHDKFMTNVLIRRLGLPGVEHEIAQDLDGARRAAERFGFPLVVKPIDSSKGRGVAANIRTWEAFDRAFGRAIRDSRRGVLVERFIAGDDHRLSVFGGRLCFASRRSPPRVVGDGSRSVLELIEQENGRRSAAAVAAGFIHRLVLDGDMLETLGAQGLGPADRPEPGRVVALRAIANVATGGTVTDVSEIVHPDNRDLAETIARAFRMDVLGLDFMTPDITRSWRDVPCAVIEVNATPGFSSDERAQRILEAKFPGGADGRIPSVVLVDAGQTTRDAFVHALREHGLVVGWADAERTQLGSSVRGLPGESLPARVTALLFDPACEALVVSATGGELERHGFPLDRCNLAVLCGRDTDAAIERLVGGCAGQVLRAGPDGLPVGAALAAVADLLAADRSRR